MRVEKETGVNYDYILALRNNGEKVLVEHFPIERHDWEIDRILEMLEDDNEDASDIYNIARRIMTSEEFNLCFGYEYSSYNISSSNINSIKPISFDSWTYRKELNKKIEDRANDRLRWLPKEERENPSNIRNAQEEARASLQREIYTAKFRIVKKILPYIYASDYTDALRKYNLSNESIVYSTDVHGYYRPKYRINEDLLIMLETNFCYGKSTHFNVIVVYKGIELLPYSVWVRYYYAGYSVLLGCTRSYSQRRDNWHNCMNFLESFINAALSNPEFFIKNEVMREIDGLMNGCEDMPGLEQVFNYDEERFEREIIVKKKGNDQRYIGIIGVHNPTETEIEDYKIAPQEISMIYKMEKISGALRFLDSLKRVNEIYGEVAKVIDRILEMNKIILPEVEQAIPPVVSEISALKKGLVPLEHKLKYCESNFDRLKKRLENILEKVYYKEKREEIIKRFSELNPKYEELKKSISELREQVDGLERKIAKRNKVKEKLQSYKDLILKYVN